MEEIEIWKQIKDFADYSVSNLGRVKNIKNINEKILSQCLRSKNSPYLCVSLTKNKIKKTFSVHILVAVAFLGHKPNGHKIEVDHIDNNRLNNNVNNLQLLTCRQNQTKIGIRGTSKYIGVYWGKTNNKWIAEISINNKKLILGYFRNEIDAANTYSKKLEELSSL